MASQLPTPLLLQSLLLTSSSPRLCSALPLYMQVPRRQTDGLLLQWGCSSASESNVLPDCVKHSGRASHGGLQRMGPLRTACTQWGVYLKLLQVQAAVSKIRMAQFCFLLSLPYVIFRSLFSFLDPVEQPVQLSKNLLFSWRQECLVLCLWPPSTSL